MSASGQAAVGQVSGLVDVEAVLACRHTSHLAGHVDLAIIQLDELHQARHTAAVQLHDSLLYLLEN